MFPNEMKRVTHEEKTTVKRWGCWTQSTPSICFDHCSESDQGLVFDTNEILCCWMKLKLSSVDKKGCIKVYYCYTSSTLKQKILYTKSGPI